MPFDVFHCFVPWSADVWSFFAWQVLLIDLANTYRFVEAQIVDDDDTALGGGEDVGLVNLWMHFLCSDVSASLNEKISLISCLF
jgi:hypothetical protein